MYTEYCIIRNYILNRMPIEKALMFISNLHNGIIPCEIIDIFAAISDLKVRRYAFDLEQKAKEDRYLEVLKARQEYEKIDREES